MEHLFVHMPIWGRPDVVRLVVKHWAHVARSILGFIQIHPFAIISPEDPDPVDSAWLDEMGWHIVEAPNMPLGAKWNAGWQAIREAATPEQHLLCGFMQVGSDNLLSPGYVEEAMARIRMAHRGRKSGPHGVDHVALDSCVFLDSETGESAICTAGGKWGYGPGRLMGLRVMNIMDFAPYTDGKSTRMDAQIDAALERAGATRQVLTTGMGSDLEPRRIMVDIKGPGSKNTWEKARARRIKSGEWVPTSKGFVPLLFPHLEWPSHMLVEG